MTPSILALVLVSVLPADLPAKAETPRKPNPFAPSLPLLTDAEEQHFDEIVDRFIQFDLGKLKGADAKQALADFKRLPPEAIFALIRGINRAANIEGSCPALVIGKKIETMLRATNDTELLEFARENIGSGVVQSRHQGYLRELRLKCLFWKRSAASRPGNLRTEPREVYVIKPLSRMTTAELAAAAGQASGPRLQTILRELSKRDGNEVFAPLAQAAKAPEKQTRQMAGELLDSFLARQRPEFIRRRLKDDRADVRALAARLIGEKGVRCFPDLIELLMDPDADVRQSARAALKQLSHGVDYGPQPKESLGHQAEAQSKWRAWLAKQGAKP